jgi:ABC-2 type transport system permease protein
MRNVISAEWSKLLPHRGTWLLVWIYPIAWFAILVISILAEPQSDPDAATAAGWVRETLPIWYVPSFSFGRYFIAAYVVLVFAGEYGWNTWKLIVPHAGRWKLLTAKYAVSLGLLYLAWIIAAALTVLMMWIKTLSLGDAVPPGVTAARILHMHFQSLVWGLIPVLLTATYASVLAVLTRSTLAAFILSLVMITLDDLLGRIVRMLSHYGMEWLAVPYRMLPSYHLVNFASWAREDVGYQLKLASGAVVACSQVSSFLLLVGWIAGLSALTLLIFRRQDLH